MQQTVRPTLAQPSEHIRILKSLGPLTIPRSPVPSGSNSSYFLKRAHLHEPCAFTGSSSLIRIDVVHLEGIGHLLCTRRRRPNAATTICVVCRSSSLSMGPITSFEFVNYTCGHLGASSNDILALESKVHGVDRNGNTQRETTLWTEFQAQYCRPQVNPESSCSTDQLSYLNGRLTRYCRVVFAKFPSAACMKPWPQISSLYGRRIRWTCWKRKLYEWFRIFLRAWD